MTSLTSAFAPATRPDADTGKPRPPSPGPVLIGDILFARCGRPSLLTLWAAWEAYPTQEESRP